MLAFSTRKYHNKFVLKLLIKDLNNVLFEILTEYDNTKH